MADPVSYGNSERDIEQALVTLKKGTQLIKYSRKGKPKFRPFRISTDETTLIWYSHGEERNLKLSSVSRIIPGQRTAVFRRYLRPEKDYLSFSLLYNNGERSLDLVSEMGLFTEVWLAGLQALISTGQHRNRRTRSDIPDVRISFQHQYIYAYVNIYLQKNGTFICYIYIMLFQFHDGGDFIQNGRPFGVNLDFASSIARGRSSVDLSSRDSSLNWASSDAGSERTNMQLRTSGVDGFRISVSSTPSCSSQGSGPDDIESLGDVYVWGEIACGVRHVALVTRQGEVFTWGEESGGRLGHGIDNDFSRPHLVEFLAVNNVDFVACGEYHTCAVSTSGDLFTWGDGTHNAGLLGHGTEVSHWIPKRVSGPLEGLQVLSVACGTWHSALATSNGKLFTFGDGTFGVLGHGDRESVPYPREVQILSGLKTIKVACGVWHTAAIIEVMSQSGTNISSRKLFTWGDGDKHRLGHGSKETYLLPTCVSALIDYNFHQLACGHTMTVALTTSGHVFTMGGTAYGQLGNPLSDGRLPCLVQDKLVGEFVEEISCGAYHVAVLTSRSEVFTWGRGANGRLGHGDTEDRRSPTFVEALKDRNVKSISCGSNFTASICIHKWVSGADQSVCSGCRQAFGFTRKRHNCYNCGLVHCHACSSKKALKAALAPTPGKPHRVCDPCYAKLKAAEAGDASIFNRKNTVPRRSIDATIRSDRGEVRSARILMSPGPINYFEFKPARLGPRPDPSPMIQSSQGPSLLKDIAFPSSLSALQNALKPVITASPQTAPPPPPQPAFSRPVSPYSRRPSPPRSAGPVFSRSVIDSLKKTNELLNQEVTKLQNQVRSLKQKSEGQDAEIQKLRKNAQEADLLALEESSKCTVAKEVVKSITTQDYLESAHESTNLLKEMEKQLPPEVYDSETFKSMQTQIEAFLNTSGTQAAEFSSSLPADLESDQKNAPVTNPLGVEDHVNAAGLTDLTQNGESSVQDSKPESTEQFEPGVYVTFIALKNGTKIFKRVRFSKRKFGGQQAEEWWKENKERLLRKYTPPASSSAPTGSSVPPAPTDESNELAQSSQT
ncbi:unnamed protein product, partial [Vitis vinifera]